MAFPEPTIGKEQLAVILGCSPRTVQDRCAAGTWPFTMPAGSLRFTEEHVRHILALGEKRPTDNPTESRAGATEVKTARRTRRRRQVEAPPHVSGTVTQLRSKPAPRLAAP